jgi:hypothetical protein
MLDNSQLQELKKDLEFIDIEDALAAYNVKSDSPDSLAALIQQLRPVGWGTNQWIEEITEALNKYRTSIPTR